MRLTKMIIVLLLLASFNSYAGQYGHPQSHELANALRVMQEQDDSGFVIVEVQGSENYIQFASESFNVAGAEGDGYIFDVPKISLTESQRVRAGEYFSRQGIDVITVGSINPVTGEEVSLETYGKLFERHEIEPGVQLGLGFILEVLEHNGPLVITRGWE
jgi:hypothetical protein